MIPLITNGMGAVLMTQLVFYGIFFMEMFLLFSILLAFVYSVRMMFNAYI